MGMFASFAVCILALSACHQASEQDCERIIDKIVELELKEQGVSNPKWVQERKAATRASKRKELLSGCVGKRVSMSAMQCIENAETSEEITEKCLR